MLLVLVQVETIQRVQDCLLPMGVTSENVAERYNVTRKAQDEAAVRIYGYGRLDGVLILHLESALYFCSR